MSYLRIGIRGRDRRGGGGGTPDSFAIWRLLSIVITQLLCETVCWVLTWSDCFACNSSDRSLPLVMPFKFAVALCTWVDLVGVTGTLPLLKFETDNNSVDWVMAAFAAACWAANCVVILIICDSLLGNDERACEIDGIDVFVLVTGSDCGRIVTLFVLLVLPLIWLALLWLVFPFVFPFERICSLLPVDICCWRSKYDWTAFFCSAFSAVLDTRVVLLGSRYVYFWLFMLLPLLLLLLLWFWLVCCRSSSLMRSATDCQLCTLCGDLQEIRN